MTIVIERDENEIVTLTIDTPGMRVNLLDDALHDALAAHVAALAADEIAAGVILTSAKESFIAGADIDLLYALDDPAEAFARVEQLKATLRRLETLGKPVVAALPGTALGGGLEVALACHHRLAIEQPEARFGFPEVTLGLLPAGGGITRLTRMLGLQAAFPLLSEGRQLDAAAAQAAGLLDGLAPDRETMLVQARHWILANPQAARPWDRPGYRLPGGDPRQPRVAQMVAVAPAMLRKRTYGNYPAPEAILSTAVEGALVDFDTACRIESRYFAQLATGRVAKNMIKVFWYQLNAVKAGKKQATDSDSRDAYTARVRAAYTNEGLLLLAEGQPAHVIEAAGRQAGMAKGPLAMSGDGESAETVRGNGRALSLPQIMERLLFVQALEAVRCYQEGVVGSVAEANVGSIFGWGFPGCHGGVLQYINTYGMVDFVTRARELATIYGERFEPPPLLEKMGVASESF